MEGYTRWRVITFGPAPERRNDAALTSRLELGPLVVFAYS